MTLPGTPPSSHLPFAFAAFCACLICPQSSPAQQGHLITGNRIVVDRSSHWRAWEVAGGTVEISPSGSVGPQFIRKNVNASLEATGFATEDNQGGATAGSNPEEADFLLDGDLSTAWGPDLESGVENWWVEVNLGRIVVVDRIVLRFAEEGDGDPFNQFKVLLWHTPPPVSAPDFYLDGTSVPNYWEIGRTDRPNKTRRVFEYFPAPRSQSGGVGHRTIITRGGFAGDALEKIRVVVTDSDLDRAEEVSAEAYELLPAGRKGATEYYRSEPSGRETAISEEEFEDLAPERRGRIRYYRRELPRLAEIEAWTAGDNLLFGLAQRGGLATVEIDSPTPKNLGNTISDGMYSTGHNGTIFGGLVYHILVDLGAHYWIDTVQFLNDGEGGIDELSVEVSDGSRTPDGGLAWRRVAGDNVAGVLQEIPAADNRAKYFQFSMEPVAARYIRAPFGNFGRFMNRKLWWGILEMLVYGEGFVAGVELTSDLILLDSSKNLLSLEWEADTPHGTSVQLRTRSGDTLDEIYIYYDSGGNIISQSRYDRLPKAKRGDIETRFEPSGDWSPWSVPYVRQGAEITSPSPRQYMQIKASILSRDPHAAARLHSIRVNFSDPVANRLVGEISPTLIDELGRPRELSFFLRPFFGSGQGFDEFRIEASGDARLDLVEARAGSDGDFELGRETVFELLELEVIDSPAGSVWFRFPEPLNRGVELVEVRFLATTYSTSTSFKAAGQDSRSPGWQRVDPGDATDLVDSQTTTLLALGGNQVIRGLEAGTRVLTPNGDGINDEVSFDFNVTRISAVQTVKLTVFDLRGVVVEELMEKRADPRGSYSMAWNGRDASGGVALPGTYIARIDVDADSESATATTAHRLVHLAY